MQSPELCQPQKGPPLSPSPNLTIAMCILSSVRQCNHRVQIWVVSGNTRVVSANAITAFRYLWPTYTYTHTYIYIASVACWRRCTHTHTYSHAHINAITARVFRYVWPCPYCPYRPYTYINKTGGDGSWVRTIGSKGNGIRTHMLTHTRWHTHTHTHTHAYAYICIYICSHL